MKKSILIGILSVIAIIVITSCDGGGTDPTNNDEILPLKIGNYWKFDAVGYDTLGNILEQSTITFKVVSDTIINNEIVYIMEIGESNIQKGTAAFIKRADGVYTYEKHNTYLEVKYPVSIGEKFNAAKDTVIVESTNFNYVTTIGNFSCYQYTWSYSDRKESLYFKPSVGYVANEIFRRTVSGRYYLVSKMVLKEYKVN